MDVVHTRQLLQQRRQTRKAKCLQGERRCKIASPISSNVFEHATGEGEEGGDLRRLGPRATRCAAVAREGSEEEGRGASSVDARREGRVSAVRGEH
jgi:hypothetical protein